MNDEQIRPLLDAWFSDRDETARDASGDIARVMADVPRTRQQGRWWPLPASDRPARAVPGRKLAPALTPAINGRARPRGFTMFSALKFVAASVIVALFASFLLAGILTTQQQDGVLPAAVTESPSPIISEDVLSGMVTEEVEPGVRRVVSDGVRDVALPAALQSSDGGLSIDPGGGIWIIEQSTAYRLGEPNEVALVRPNDTEWGRGHSLSAVTADGTLWGVTTTADMGGPTASIISSLDGESWADRATLDGSTQVAGIATTPDGTAWATTVDSSQCPDDHSAPSCRQTLLVRIDETGASTSPGWEGAEAGRLSWHKPVVSPDGDLWLVDDGDTEMEGCSVDVFHRYDGIDWHAVDVPEGLNIAQMGESFGFGSDGTLWAAITVGGMDEADCSEANHGLARLDESGWSVFTENEGVRPWGSEYVWGGSDLLRVAPDGSVWVNGVEDGVDCDGLASFDGVSWTPYMQDLCVDDLDITPDGTIWVLASGGPGGTDHLYVITPQAVAATG